MFLILLAAQVAAQAPVVQPAPKAAKPKQVCEMVDLTGSRSKRRICHNVNDSADLTGYGVSNSGYGKVKIDGTTNGVISSTVPQ